MSRRPFPPCQARPAPARAAAPAHGDTARPLSRPLDYFILPFFFFPFFVPSFLPAAVASVPSRTPDAFPGLSARAQFLGPCPLTRGVGGERQDGGGCGRAAAGALLRETRGADPVPGPATARPAPPSPPFPALRGPRCPGRRSRERGPRCLPGRPGRGPPGSVAPAGSAR